ncbi:MAG: triose-phosphate isomerase [Desulfobacterales bacterium]
MNNRVPLVAGNWKMFKTCPEAVETARQLVQLLSDATGVEVMIAPPFTALSPVSDALNESNISLGAQNLFWEKEGAYTGEISPAMLVSAGCRYVIIGHSERRQYFGENDGTVNKKIKAALNARLIPILCIGESENERESDRTFSVLDKQIKIGLKDLVSKDLDRMILAYEPVWAIGTGKTATSDQAQEVHQFLRSLLEKSFGTTFSQLIRILYGGSVKPDNISELMAMPDIDGALVGGASLDPDTFSKIVNHIGLSL